MRLLGGGGSGVVGRRVLRMAVGQGQAAASFGPGEAAGTDGVARFAGAVEEGGQFGQALRSFAPDAVIWAAGHNPGDGLARAATADPARSVAVNAGGFAAMLAACAQVGVDRVVQCGSTVVYGPPDLYPPGRVDEDAVAAPRSAYGLSKLMAEIAAEWGSDALGLSVTTMRLPLVLGPGRWYVGTAGAYARMLRAALDGTTLQETVPAAPFDAVHVDDAAAALLRLAADPAAPRRLNMAGVTITLAEVATALRRLFPACRLDLTGLDEPPALPLVNDARLRALGWVVRRGLDAILSDTLDEMSKESA